MYSFIELSLFSRYRDNYFSEEQFLHLQKIPFGGSTGRSGSSWHRWRQKTEMATCRYGKTRRVENPVLCTGYSGAHLATHGIQQKCP